MNMTLLNVVNRNRGKRTRRKFFGKMRSWQLGRHASGKFVMMNGWWTFISGSIYQRARKEEVLQ